MDYVSSLLDRYYDIFQYIINNDKYCEFIHLKKNLIMPYAAIFHQNQENEVSKNTNQQKSIDQDSTDITSKDPLEHLLKLHRQIAAAVWKKFRYRLVSIDDWDPSLDKYDVFHLLGGSDPLVVIPSTPKKALGVKWAQEKLLGIDRHEFFIVAIDPQLNRKDLWKLLRESLSVYIGEKDVPRKSRKRKIPRYHAFDLARKNNTFAEIGLLYGVDASTAHKAFCKDFEDKYGHKHSPTHPKRRMVPFHQLPKTCGTCNDRGNCTKICPEIEAFASQDEISQKELLSKY